MGAPPALSSTPSSVPHILRADSTDVSTFIHDQDRIQSSSRDDQISHVPTTSVVYNSNNTTHRFDVVVYPTGSTTPPRNQRDGSTTAYTPIKPAEYLGTPLQAGVDRLTAQLPTIIEESAKDIMSNDPSDTPNCQNPFDRDSERPVSCISNNSIPPSISQASCKSTQTLKGPENRLRHMEQKELKKFSKSPPYYTQIYTQEMWAKIQERTICLWSPYPNQNLSKDLQEKCYTLGDVGMFDDCGNFEVFFNIFMSKEENLQMWYRPPTTFQPIEAKNYEVVISIDEAWHFCTPDFRYSEVPDPETGQLCSLTFESIQKPSKPGGAILALPKGYIRGTILSAVIADIEVYLQHHVESWYATTNHWNLLNNRPDGALKLIYTYYKSPVWGAGVLARDECQEAIPPIKMERLAADQRFRWNAPGRPIRTKKDRNDISYTVAVELFSVFRSAEGPKKGFLPSLKSIKSTSSHFSTTSRATKRSSNSRSMISQMFRSKSRPQPES